VEKYLDFCQNLNKIKFIEVKHTIADASRQTSKIINPSNLSSISHLGRSPYRRSPRGGEFLVTG
jgi:hypothetical protein